MKTTIQITNADKYKLCYVDGDDIYFTTQALSEQWGDDWNDAPYEHNAGRPYEPSESDIEKGNVWHILKLKIDTGLDAPCDGYSNSPYSVQAINQKVVPWLKWKWGENPIEIYAGIRLEKFIEIIKAEKLGTIYFPVNLEELI